MGQLHEMNTSDFKKIYAQRGAFFAATKRMKISRFVVSDETFARYSQLGSVLQEITGPDDTRYWLEVHGDVYQIDLKPNTSIRVMPGSVLAMTEGIKAEIVPFNEKLQNDIIVLTKQQNMIKFTAGNDGATVWFHSIVPRELKKALDEC